MGARHSQNRKKLARGKRLRVVSSGRALSLVHLSSLPPAPRENNAMLRLALAASKRGAASAVAESVLPSATSAAAFTRSFAALPATTSESSSPFLRFASPAPAAHDFTPALQGLPETKVKKRCLLMRRREREREKKRRRTVVDAIIEEETPIAFFFRALFLSNSLFPRRSRSRHLTCWIQAFSSRRALWSHGSERGE